MMLRALAEGGRARRAARQAGAVPRRARAAPGLRGQIVRHIAENEMLNGEVIRLENGAFQHGAESAARLGGRVIPAKRGSQSGQARMVPAIGGKSHPPNRSENFRRSNSGEHDLLDHVHARAWAVRR